MRFYRRDTHIAEIQMGQSAARLEDACLADYFDVNRLPYITLMGMFKRASGRRNEPTLTETIAGAVTEQVCPLEGLYGLRGAIGPPYVTSRHKRNHNKGHHHHHDGHKRYAMSPIKSTQIG